MFRRAAIQGIVLLMLLTACSAARSGPLVVDALADSPPDYEYIIPDNTGDRIRGGESITILPAELNVRVGEVIRIVNEDSEGHFVGIFYVAARQELTQRFYAPGEFSGRCSVHPSGQITLTISE